MTHIEIKDRHGAIIRVCDAEQSKEIASVWMFVLHEGDKSGSAVQLDQKHARELGAALDRFAYDADTQPLVHEARVSRVEWHKASETLPKHSEAVLCASAEGDVWMGVYSGGYPEGWYVVGSVSAIPTRVPVAYWRELPLPPPC